MSLLKIAIPLALGAGVIALASGTASAKEKNAVSPGEVPPAIQSKLVEARTAKSPTLLDAVASELERAGMLDQARAVRAEAARLRDAIQRSSMPKSPGVPGTRPAVTLPSAPKEMSPQLQQVVAEALRQNTAPMLTSAAFVAEQAGFPEVAAELRRRAKEVAASVPPPPRTQLPNVALDPQMPADLAAQVARQMQLQGDPALLEALARELRARGFTASAEQLEAKAKQIRAALDAAATMAKIDQVVSTSPGQPTGTPPTPRPTQVIPTQVITATPPAPVQVPPVAIPQPAPVQKSKNQLLAEALAAHLNDLLKRYGSVPKSRYKEDKSLVQKFQTQEGDLKPDGLYGPKAATALAKYVDNVPPPFWWAKGAGQKDLNAYRTGLQSLALDADQLGNTARAAALRASALKASLA